MITHLQWENEIGHPSFQFVTLTEMFILCYIFIQAWKAKQHPLDNTPLKGDLIRLNIITW